MFALIIIAIVIHALFTDLGLRGEIASSGRRTLLGFRCDCGLFFFGGRVDEIKLAFLACVGLTRRIAKSMNTKQKHNDEQKRNFATRFHRVKSKYIIPNSTES
jgi:hypothetical protein